MQDSDLKKLLLETCPIRPGQESRAWSVLQERLFHQQPRSVWSWLYYPTWRGLILAVVTLALIPLVGSFFGSQPVGLITAESQAPGIYATAFYSRPAQAQVVWLNGMEPATDKLTYMDPTMVIGGTTATSPAKGDPNSL